MSNIIKVIGFDPSTSNFGIAQCSVNLDTSEIEVSNLILNSTESEKLKGVTKQSDDLRRAKELIAGMNAACVGYAIAMTEMPFFSPVARPAANFGAGLTTGVMGACSIPIIQVSPRQVKMVAVGDPQATKDQMIEWAIAKYPNANWRTYTRKGKPVLNKDNEHLADAIAAVHAGVLTVQFAQAVAMMASLLKAA